MTASPGPGHVLAHTQIAHAFLVPELQLHLLTPKSPLWTASIEVAAQAGLPMPYWAFAWPGGQALARHLLDCPELVRGRRVLDFGSGGALVGLAAMRAGASAVLCADLDPLASVAARLNAALNDVAISTTTDELIGRTGPWDVVLAGDVLYDAELAGRILGWLQSLVRAGATVLLGDAGRVALDPSVAIEVRANYQAPFDGDPRGTTLWDCRVLQLRA